MFSVSPSRASVSPLKLSRFGSALTGPNSYVNKERAVRACENIYAVGDAVGMCRFTTKLFNSPTLPGLEEFREQLANVTGQRRQPAPA